jgi:membrane protein YdbS with pleckstrin-like domain
MRGGFRGSLRSLRDWRSYGPSVPFWTMGPGWPVRGVALGVFLGFLIVAATFRIDDPHLLILAYVLAIVVMIVPMMLEKAHWRDYVTPTRFVHQHGLLGRVRKAIPLAAIERVEVSTAGYWPAAESWDVADLRLHTPGDVTTIAFVCEPKKVVQAIEEIKAGTYRQSSVDS